MNYIRGNDPRLLILQSKYPLCQKVEQSTETQDKHLEETADLLESPFYSSHMHHFHQDSLLQTRINITNLRQRDYSCKRNYRHCAHRTKFLAGLQQGTIQTI